VALGAVLDGKRLAIAITAQKPWTGVLYFDTQRYKNNMHLPMDWPRINQFPEWFTIDPEKTYNVNRDGVAQQTSLNDGLALDIPNGTTRLLIN